MKNPLWLICLFFVVLFGAGCSTKIDGDVYVLGNNGTSNKLASVGIYAVPTKNLESFEKIANTKRDKIKEECLAVVPTFGLKNFLQEKEAMLEVVRVKNVKRLAYASATGHSPDLDNLMLTPDYSSLNSRMIESFSSAKAPEVYAKISALDPLVFYSTEIAPFLNGAQVVKTVSNSDGKFSLELPNSDFVLVATTESQKDRRNHLWMVKLNSKDKTVTLSDPNAFDKKCDRCFLQQVDQSLRVNGPLARGFYIVSSFTTKSKYLVGNHDQQVLFEWTKEAGFL